MAFNKYSFLEETESEIKELILKAFKEGSRDLDIDDEITQTIDNLCIYNYDCWEICMEFRPSDFSDSVSGQMCTTIEQLAFSCLYEFVNDEGLRNTLQDYQDELNELESKKGELQSLMAEFIEKLGRSEAEDLIHELLSEL